MGRASGDEVRRVRRIRGPQTVAEVAATGAAGGILLLVAFAVLHALARPAPLPVAPGRVSAQARPPAPPSAIPGDLGPGRLRFPVPAVSPAAMSDSFAQARGERSHLAVDILAPRGSPVVAVDDGTLVRLSSSPAGGISVYQLDAGEHHCFFYAHLERYAEGLTEGQFVKRGEVIAYVGTTGNAPPEHPASAFRHPRADVPETVLGRASRRPLPALALTRQPRRGAASGGRVRPPDHDRVEPGAAEEEPAALLVEAPGGVEAEEAVGQHLQEPPGLVLEPLGVGAGHEDADSAVQEGEEELVRLPVREEVVHLLPAVEGRREAEEGLGPGLNQPAQDPLAALPRVVGALVEDPFRVEERGIAALPEAAQGIEQGAGVLLEFLLRVEHGSTMVSRAGRATHPLTA